MMNPCIHSDDMAYCCLGQSKPLADLALGEFSTAVKLADCVGILFGYLRPAMPGTLGRSLWMGVSPASLARSRSPLHVSIADIMPVRPTPQVRGIAATGVVACVAHQMFADPAGVKKKRHAVSLPSTIPETKSPVPVFIQSSLPRPTRVLRAALDISCKASDVTVVHQVNSLSSQHNLSPDACTPILTTNGEVVND